MSFNKSHQRDLDERTRELEKRNPGKGGQALEERQLAQNQLQAIQNEQRNNLLAQKTESDAMNQTNQLLNQAAELGVSGSTAATLGKYGMKTAPRVQRTQGRDVRVTPNKITIINNNNTTTTNNTQVAGGGGGSDNPSKFKTWLSKVNAQQAEFASKRERDYSRRESNLTRAANKMLRRIEATGKNIADTFSPSSFGQSVGNQLKMYLMIFGMRFLSKYWTKILEGIQWVIDTTSEALAWFGIGQEGDKNLKAGKGFVPTIIRLLGGDPKKEGGVLEAFKNTMVAVFDYFSMKLEHMFEKRAEAIKQVKFSWDSSGGSSLLGGILKNTGIENLFSGITTYLGDILTALMNPSAAARNSVGKKVQAKGMEGSQKHMNTNEFKNAAFGVDQGELSVLDKSNKKRYGLITGAVDQGNNLTDRRGGQISQSLDIVGVLRDAKTTGVVDTARLLSGLERMQQKARRSGWVAVDYEFLTSFLPISLIKSLTASGHIRVRKYKVVKVKKDDAYGSLWDYGKAALFGSMGPGTAAVVGGADAAMGGGSAATVAAGAATVAGTLGKFSKFAKLGGPIGTAASLGVGLVAAGIQDYAENDNTLQIVPLDDPRPAFNNKYVDIWEIDEFTLRRIASQFGGATNFSTADEQLMKQLESFIYRTSGGVGATKARYKGKGSNETFNIDEGFASAHAFDSWSETLDEEEDNSELMKRLTTSGNEIKSIANNVVSGGKKVVKGVVNAVTGPDSGDVRVDYDPKTGKYINAGYGNQTERIQDEGGRGSLGKTVRQWTGGRTLKVPSGNMGYKYNTEIAAKRALELTEFEIYNNKGQQNSDWKKKRKSPTKRANGGETCAGYARRAIAAGLGITELRKGQLVPPAKACDYVHFLGYFGFQPVSWDGYSPRKGDIVVFGPIPSYRGGYISIFAGTCWASDFKQSSMWPDNAFEAEKCATVFRHISPVSNFSAADVNTINSYDLFDSGYIDLDGDGVYDVAKTAGGDLYRVNADGSLGEKMSISELNSSLTANSTFSSVSSGYMTGNYTPGHYDSVTVSGLGSKSAWARAVITVKTWWETNVHRYEMGGVQKNCPILGGGNIKIDCSGFVSACLVKYGVKVYNPVAGCNAPNSDRLVNDKITRKVMEEGGFTLMPNADKGKSIQPFDILVTPNHHTEIAAEKTGESYNWGNVHDKAHGGMPSGHAEFWRNCKWIWRCTSVPSGIGTDKDLVTLGEGGSITIDSWDGPVGGTYTLPGENRGASGSGGGGITISGKAITNAEQRQNAAALVNFFVGKGLSREAAFAIVGNLMAESGLNSAAVGDHGTSGGIAQWHKERWDQLKAFAESRGKPWTDLGTQAEFIWHELNSSKKHVLNALQNSNSIEDASFVWGDQYEVFAGHQNRFGSEHLKRKNLALQLSGDVGNSNFSEVTEFISNAVDDVVEIGKEAIDAGKKIIEDAKESLPGSEKKYGFVGLGKDADEKVKKMSDSEKALQIWNTNPDVQQTWAAYGYDFWKKNVFDKYSDKKKTRYLLEQEGRTAYLSSVAELKNNPGGDEFYSEAKAIFGDVITPEMLNEYGLLNEVGLNKIGQLYANLSPEDRKDLLTKMKLGKARAEYVDSIKNPDYFEDIDWKDVNTALGLRIGEERKEIVEGRTITKGHQEVVTQEEKIRRDAQEKFARAVLNGDIDRATQIFRTNKKYFDEDDPILKAWNLNIRETKEGRRGIGAVLGRGSFEDALLHDILGRSLETERWNKEQEKINEILESERFKKNKEYLGNPDINAEGNHTKEAWNRLYRLNRDETAYGYLFNHPDKNSSHFDKETYEKEKDILEKDVKAAQEYYADQYNILKSKYVQQHLVDEFESISDKDSGMEAYEKEQRNKQRAALNQKIADLRFRRDNYDMDLMARFQNDEEFRKNFLWNYGEGAVARKLYQEGEEGKKEREDLIIAWQNALEERDRISGKKIFSNEKLRKMMRTLNGLSDIVTPEEAELMKKYGTTGFQVEGVDNRFKHVSEVIANLLTEVAAGSKTIGEARTILTHQGVAEDLISDSQLKNIKKSKTYDNQGILRVVEDEEGNLHAYGVDGKELQIKDQTTGKLRSRTNDEILDMSYKTQDLLGKSEAYTKRINGKLLKLYDIQGERLYIDELEDGSKNYYDLKGNFVRKELPQSITAGNQTFPGTIQSSITPEIVSQTSMMIQKHFQDLAEKGAWGIGNITMTKEDKDNIRTQQVNFEGKSLEDLVSEIKDKVGDLSANAEEELRRQYEANPRGSIQVTSLTVGGYPAKMIQLPTGQMILEKSPELTKSLYKGDEAAAIKVGFSSAAAKVYAENQQRDTAAYRLMKQRMDAQGLSLDAQVGQTVGQIYSSMNTLLGAVNQIANNMGLDTSGNLTDGGSGGEGNDTNPDGTSSKLNAQDSHAAAQRFIPDFSAKPKKTKYP